MGVSTREAKYLVAHPDILLALSQGKTIEYKETPDAQWVKIVTPAFVEGMEYRVKPEPRTWYLVLRKDGTAARICTTEAEAKEAVVGYDAGGHPQSKPYSWIEVQEVVKD